MLSYKYYLNIVTCTVSKHTATVLSCYHINITLTQSHVQSVNTQLQYVGRWTFCVSVWRGQQKLTVMNRYFIFVTLQLLYVGRPGESSEKSLLWLWTNVAIMLDWGSNTLDVIRAGIFVISYCLYGFVYCTVLMLTVLTDGRWKLAGTYCNTIRCHHCGVML